MNKRTLSWIILISLSIVWGSSFILMKRGLDSFTSDEVAALRISIAFLFLVPFLIRHWKIDFKKYYKGLLIMGIFGNLIPAFLFTLAETRISSSLTGMLNALTPLFTVLVALIWIKINPSPRKILGIIIGFIAAVCLILFEHSDNMFSNFSYGFLVLLATICYAISINGIKKYLGDLNSIKATVWAFAFTGPPSLIYLLFFSDFSLHMAANPGSMTSLGYIVILAVFGTALSVMLYNLLIKNAGVLFASSCTYLIPIVAVLWGLFDGEKVNLPQIFSIFVIILSVYLINKD
jgi:drug/metabolite transporter (DMT)-like permease